MPAEMVDDPYRPGLKVRQSQADIAPADRLGSAVDARMARRQEADDPGTVDEV